MLEKMVLQSYNVEVRTETTIFQTSEHANIRFSDTKSINYKLYT